MAASPHCAYRSFVAAGLLALVFVAGPTAADDPLLFKSKPLPGDRVLTQPNQSPGSEAQGKLYVVNLDFAHNGTKDGGIGRLAPGATKFELFTTLHDPNSDKQSIGNGIRFDRDGRMFIADFVNHNVFVIEPGQTTAKPYFHSDD